MYIHSIRPILERFYRSFCDYYDKMILNSYPEDLLKVSHRACRHIYMAIRCMDYVHQRREVDPLLRRDHVFSSRNFKKGA